MARGTRLVVGDDLRGNYIGSLNTDGTIVCDSTVLRPWLRGLDTHDPWSG
jgi:hypothetical protein